MGILSEIDMMNRDAEDDAFEVSLDSENRRFFQRRI